MRFDRLVLAGSVLLAGCGSAHVADAPSPQIYRTPLHSLRGAPAWAPNYISTGLSTGIMMSSAPANGGRMTIDVWRYPIETTSVSQVEEGSDQPVEVLEIRTAQVVLTAAVNDLGQAFFKVPPGVYLLHPRLARLPHLHVPGVEVREGSYAIVPVPLERVRAATPEEPLPVQVRN